MAIGLSQELHTARLVHLLQFLQHLRRMHLQLFDTCTRERERYFEVLAVLLDHIVEGIQGRHIAALGNVSDATLILVVIVVIMIGTDIEETVTLQMNNLMYLEI